VVGKLVGGINWRNKSDAKGNSREIRSKEFNAASTLAMSERTMIALLVSIR